MHLSAATKTKKVQRKLNSKTRVARRSNAASTFPSRSPRPVLQALSHVLGVQGNICPGFNWSGRTRTQSVSGSPTCKKKRVCWIKLDSHPSPSHSAGPLQWAALQSQGFPARLRPTPADLRGHVPARESGKEMQGVLTTPPRVLLPHQLAMPTFARQGKDP